MRRNLKIYFILLSIIIYFTLNYIYNNFISGNDTVEIYVLNKDVKRGDILSKDIFEKVSINKNNQDNVLEYSNINLNDKERYFLNDNYLKGQVILKSMIETSKEYQMVENSKERVSIKIQDSSDAVSFNLNKGNIINIYFTAKKSQFDNLLSMYTSDSIVSSNNSESYITILILKNIRVVNIYDKNGNELKNTNIKSDGSVIDTITVEVANIDSIMINNLKNYGRFSISLLN